MPDDRDNNKIAIWPNAKKITDRHPDFTGTGIVEGREFWISAWSSDGSNPRAPVLKISLTPKDATAQAGIAQTKQATGIGIQPVQGQVAQRPAAAMPDARASAEDAIPFPDDIPF